jgi:hypothetical protein
MQERKVIGSNLKITPIPPLKATAVPLHKMGALR